MQPTGPRGRLFPSHCQSHEPYSCRIRTGADNSNVPLTLPCVRVGAQAGRSPQHPRPLNTTSTPRRFEHNFSWVLTFSTSSLQSCRGHRATGKEISVGDVEKHSALTPIGKDAPWTQQANSGDKLALHPAAAARLMSPPLIPAPLSSVSQWEDKSRPPEPAALQLCSLPGLLQQLRSTGSRKKRIKQQSSLNSKGHSAEACRD